MTGYARREPRPASRTWSSSATCIEPRIKPRRRRCSSGELPLLSFPAALGELFLATRARSSSRAPTARRRPLVARRAAARGRAGRIPAFLVGGVPKNFGRTCAPRRGRRVRRRGRRVRHGLLRQGPEVPALPAARRDAHLGRVRPRRHLPRPRRVEDAFRRPDRDRSRPTAVIVGADAARSRGASATRRARVCALGAGPGGRPGDDGVDDAGRTPFVVRARRPADRRVSLVLLGRHNLLQRAGGGRGGRRSSASMPTALARGFASFGGVQPAAGGRRRARGGVTVVDDFAHHPTAVRVTLDALRLPLPASVGCWAVFEPRSATSRRRGVPAGSTCEPPTGRTVLAATRSTQATRSSPRRTGSAPTTSSTDLRHRGCRPGVPDGGPAIAATWWSRRAGPHVVVIMSNGAFGGLHKKLLELLAARFALRRRSGSEGSRRCTRRRALRRAGRLEGADAGVSPPRAAEAAEAHAAHAFRIRGPHGPPDSVAAASGPTKVPIRTIFGGFRSDDETLDRPRSVFLDATLHPRRGSPKQRSDRHHRSPRPRDAERWVAGAVPARSRDFR